MHSDRDQFLKFFGYEQIDLKAETEKMFANKIIGKVRPLIQDSIVTIEQNRHGFTSWTYYQGGGDPMAQVMLSDRWHDRLKEHTTSISNWADKHRVTKMCDQEEPAYAMAFPYVMPSLATARVIVKQRISS